jgi:hypothetical protein
MKIKVTEVIKNEIDIELPLFWKHPTEETYLGVIDEKNVIDFDMSSTTYKRVTHCEIWLKANDIEKANEIWIAISEEMFLDAHQKAIQSLSLVPIIEIRNHKLVNQG